MIQFTPVLQQRTLPPKRVSFSGGDQDWVLSMTPQTISRVNNLTDLTGFSRPQLFSHMLAFFEWGVQQSLERRIVSTTYDKTSIYSMLQLSVFEKLRKQAEQTWALMQGNLPGAQAG